ncbi:MAG TPA: hypothetical protein VL728_11770 [Cyclobacteriaceae bacterium]|jgi:hypothetical protein|nr:hypothetical protein [Cyclobacteriaceae bacterium]
MNEIETEAKKNSFWFSLIYVGVGDLALLALFSNARDGYDFIFYIVGLVLLVTAPVFLINFAVLYGGGENKLVPILLQVAIFLLTWFISYRYLRNKYLRREKLRAKEEGEESSKQKL